MYKFPKSQSIQPIQNSVQINREDQTRKPKLAALGRKLLIEGIAFVTISSLPLVSGCATSNHNSSRWNWNNRTGQEENNEIVSAEADIVYKGEKYHVRVETRDNWDKFMVYWDAKEDPRNPLDMSPLFKRFDGKLTRREIIFGDNSFMIKGISSNGMYGFILVTQLAGSTKLESIYTYMPVEEFESKGGEVVVHFDKKNDVWLIIDKFKDEILSYSLFSKKTGKSLGIKTIVENWDFIIFNRKIFERK